MPARFALALLLALPEAAAWAQQDPFPEAAAAYLVLVDGTPRWERAADAPRQPASLAKLMSALVVVDEGRLDEEVRVSRAATRARGARLGLRAGERLFARDLLAGMLVGSANDACVALATREGSVAAFVARMNERAPQIGLRDTQFGDPCGFDRRGQHTTARDLARLATVALRRPQIAALVQRREVELVTASGERVLRVRNTNALLEHFPGVVGVKTGQTRRAGENLIALAERDGHKVLLVMLGARDRWWDAHAILARALER